MALSTYGIYRKTSREHAQKVPGHYEEQGRLDGLLSECVLVLYVHCGAKKEKLGFLQNFSSKRVLFLVEQTVSEGSVFTILYESLGMRKLFSKWVPLLLTTGQK